jgi:catechol 2,3-dioxygenase-like lactoylglutathione lyase family enzyme
VNNEESEIQVLKPHVALNVGNLWASVEFYRKMLSIEPSKVRPGYAKFDVLSPALNLSLNEGAVGGRGTLSHLGIQVSGSDDVVRIRKRWTEAGLDPRDQMQTNCCYALQDKSWVHDPDGNQWEVFAVLEDTLDATSACCGAAGEQLTRIEL